MGVQRIVVALGVLCAVVLAMMPTASAQGSVWSNVESPPSGSGPLLVLLTGADGAPNHLGEAKAFAAEGWVVVVVEGNRLESAAPGSVSAAIKDALARPDVRSAKASLVGYSIGGWQVIAYGNRLPHLVSAAVAYYPSTWRVGDPRTFWSSEATVPTLVLAGVRDTYMNCCTIDRARVLAAAAVESKLPVELVEIAEADHGFVLPAYPVYRPEDAAEARRRAVAHLRRAIVPK